MNLTNWQRFHNDLKAAIIAGVPIEIGGEKPSESYDRLTLDKLSRLESDLQPLVTGGQFLMQTLDSLETLPRRYRAALVVFDQTGSMIPVLDGLTALRSARDRVTRTLRCTLLYLMLVLLIAFCGLSLFDFRIVPVVEEMRADLLLPAAINAPPRIDPLPWLPTIVAVLGIGIVLISIWLITGGVTKAALWLGGRKYVRWQVSATAIQTLQMLMASGMNFNKAVSVSCDLTVADPVAVGEITAAAQDPEKVRQLDPMSECFASMAGQRLAYLRVATPIALISLLGGGVVAMYAVLIFWPIISMLKDLATAGT